MSLVRGSSKVITLTPDLAADSVAATTAYSSGDVIGDHLTVSKAVLDTKGTALLQSLTVLDKANQKSALDLIFFNEEPAASYGANNSAYGLNDSDLSKVIGRISVAAADYVSSGSNNAEATLRNLGLLLQSLEKSKDVYVLVVARGTPTFGANGDLIIKLGLLQD